MKAHARQLVVLLIFMAVPATMFGAELGTPAPALQIGKWIIEQPAAAEQAEVTPVYVINFWATWCGACLANMPRLSAMQREYRDQGVVVIGISPEDAREVERFIKGREAPIEFAVGVDDDRKTYQAYERSFGMRGVPYAFVVDRSGKVVWSGHPAMGLETAVANAVGAPRTAGESALGRKLFMVYRGLAQCSEEYDVLQVLGEDVLEYGADDARLLDMFAWMIVDDEGLAKNALDQSLKAASRAHELSEGKDASILDTYARVLFLMGRVKEALELQKRAVTLDPDEKDYRKRLKEYSASQGRSERGKSARLTPHRPRGGG